MVFPCPFCKKTFDDRQGCFGHMTNCKKYHKWRKTHTKIQAIVFMRTGWRKKVFFPEFSATTPVYSKVNPKVTPPLKRIPKKRGRPKKVKQTLPELSPN
jgi:hypothetical protein